MISTLRVYGSDNQGMPDTRVYDEFTSAAEALADLWAWSMFPAHRLET